MLDSPRPLTRSDVRSGATSAWFTAPAALSGTNARPGPVGMRSQTKELQTRRRHARGARSQPAHGYSGCTVDNGDCCARTRPTRVQTTRLPLACHLRSLGSVSQKNVEIVIGRLATDEALRARFLRDPWGTLRQLGEAGLELNPGEIDALLSLTPDFLKAIGDWVHPRLQKALLKDELDAS